MNEADVFGHERRTILQLKDHQLGASTRALEQVEEACDAYAPVAAAVIISTADEDPEFAAQRERLAEDLGIPITPVLGKELAAWFLKHLDEIASD